MSRHQKGKTNMDFTEARDSEWQWHPLGPMQVSTCSRQITTPAPHHSVFYRPDALPAAQPTASKHYRRYTNLFIIIIIIIKPVMRRQEGADLEQQWTDDVAGENAGTWFTRRHLTLLDTAVCAAAARRVIYTTTTTSSNHHQQQQT